MKYYQERGKVFIKPTRKDPCKYRLERTITEKKESRKRYRRRVKVKFSLRQVKPKRFRWTLYFRFNINS